MATEDRTTGRDPGGESRSSKPNSSQKVSDVMTPNPSCVTEKDSIRAVAKLMLDGDCGAVPVVDSSDRKKLVGMITDRDIVIRLVAEGRNPEQSTVADAMSRGVHSVKEDESIDSVYQIMSREQVRRVPVVGRNDEVVGIVAVADVASNDENDRLLARTVEKISDDDGKTGSR